MSTVTASPKVYQRIDSVLGMVLFPLKGAIGCFPALRTGSPSPPSLSITPLATKQCLANNRLLLITMKLSFCAICHLHSSSKNVLGTPLVASAVYWDHSKQIVLEMFLFTWAYHVRIQNKLQNNNRGERTLPLCFNIHLFIDKCKFIHGELPRGGTATKPRALTLNRNFPYAYFLFACD